MKSDPKTERNRTTRNRAVFLVLLLGFVPSAVSAQGFANLEQRVSALFFGEIDIREREGQGEDGFAIGQSVAQFNVLLDE